MHKIAILAVVLFCLISSCIGDRYYTLLTIKNNANKDIYFSRSNLYPDTSINLGIYIPKGATATPSETIHPGESLPVITRSSVTLDKYFADNVPSNTLEVFIYDVSVVKTTPWDSVVAKYLILKRYDLTVDSLKKLNGVITYP